MSVGVVATLNECLHLLRKSVCFCLFVWSWPVIFRSLGSPEYCVFFVCCVGQEFVL